MSTKTKTNTTIQSLDDDKVDIIFKDELILIGIYAFSELQIKELITKLK